MPILYTPDKPGVYKSEDVYVRAVDGPEPIATRIVPAVRSFVIFPDNVVKIVVSVDINPTSPTYLDSTLGNVILTVTDNQPEPINYGKDVLMLYYDTRQSPTRIIVDKKLVIPGENSIGYRIIRSDNDGNRVVISSNLNIQGEVVGNIIPVVDIEVNNIVEFSPGWTFYTLTPGEVVTLELVDSAGIVTLEAQLTTKQATILNTLEFASNPITGFDADCSQTQEDKWVIYLGQNIEELSIFPYITYADGTKHYLTVDNLSTYMYGYEDINNTFPGNLYTIVIKYFLGKDEFSDIAQEVDGQRFVTMTKELIIDSQEKYNFSKISLIPIWNTGTSRYTLRYVGYHETRNAFTDVTSRIQYLPGFTYNNTLVNQEQELRISVPYIEPGGMISDEMYTETFYLTLGTPASLEPFKIKSTVDGLVYGAQNAQNNRPIIHYDGNISKYFIASSIFPNTAEFIRNFYRNATPPYLSDTETVAPEPTHFTIRDSVSKRPLLTSPVSVSSYNTALTFLTLTAPANSYVNSTVIVEWLAATANGYSVLYGTPVQVLLSQVGYIG